jgi:hypothetical protein
MYKSRAILRSTREKVKRYKIRINERKENATTEQTLKAARVEINRANLWRSSREEQDCHKKSHRENREYVLNGAHSNWVIEHESSTNKHQ